MGSPIPAPAKVRVDTINGNISTIGDLLQTAMQALDPNTDVISINYIRSENSQGVACLLTYQIP